MLSKDEVAVSIDEYISRFPADVQKKLNELRAVIRANAPDAIEKISYQMPTFWQNGNLVHFAAYKNHIGFYPTPSVIDTFKSELAAYEQSKGAIRFPLDKPIPFDLIGKFVAFRVKQSIEKDAAKKKKVK